MKKLFLSVVFILLSHTIIFAQSSNITKHALIFAIGNYPTDSTGWPKISSANDAVLLKDALDFQGFEDITIVQDTGATKHGIIKNILTFTEGLLEGDFAVIHFSCHGQLMQDANGDAADGYYEALVPIDAPCGKGKFAPADYNGEKHLKLNELAPLILDIRKKLGPKGDLVLILDANHSGTSVHGYAKCRGDMPTYKYSGKNLTAAGNNETLVPKDQNVESLAAYIVINACRPNENNMEISDYNCGSLSFAVAKALKECQTGTTYRKLFGNVQSIMNTKVPNQTATIEGNIERKLFNGEFIVQHTYLSIFDVIDDRTIIINAGNLAGLADSSKVSIYPNATYDNRGKTPVASGLVISSDNTTSTVTLNSKLLINNKASKWIFVTSKSFNDMRIKVRSTDLKNPALNTFVYNTLHANNMVNVVLDTTAELIVSLSKAKGNALIDIINANNGSILKSNCSKENLDKAILNYLQGKYVKEMDFKSPDYKIDMEIIPVKKGSFEPLNIQDYLVKGTVEFDTTCQFMIRAKNSGKLPCYVNIIEIRPEGKIYSVLPSNDQQYSQYGADYFYLEAGRTKDFEVRIAGHSPYGTIIYKAIASGQLIDLRSIINNQGTWKREGETIFEKLFRESYINTDNFQTRGTKPKAVPADIGVTTSNYPVIIKKLK